jgi:hypothetical protein
VVGRADPARVVQGARVVKAEGEGQVLPVKVEDPVERGDKQEANQTLARR